MINGHQLPSEPDETLNNATLLGVDVNDNGVRDDRERWIYDKYKDKHPIHIDVAMQAGRAWQQILKNPTEAKHIVEILHAAQGCEAYYQNYAKYFNESILVTDSIITKNIEK